MVLTCVDSADALSLASWPYVLAWLPIWMCLWIQGSTLVRSVKIPGDPWSSFCRLFLQPRPQPKPQEVTPARVQVPFLFRHMREPPESPCREKRSLLLSLSVSVPHRGARWGLMNFFTSNTLDSGAWENRQAQFTVNPQIPLEPTKSISFFTILSFHQISDCFLLLSHPTDSEKSCPVVKSTSSLVSRTDGGKEKAPIIHKLEISK